MSGKKVVVCPKTYTFLSLLKCLNVLNISKMIKISKAKWFQRSY